MAEVGVLQLTIRDNSEKAASGLNNLAGALERVRDAINFGTKLGNLSAKIESLGQAMNTHMPATTITRINNLAKALESLSKVGAINIRFNGIEAMNQRLSTTVAAVEEIQKATKINTPNNSNRAMALDLQQFGGTGKDTSIQVMQNELKDTKEYLEELHNEWKRVDTARKEAIGTSDYAKLEAEFKEVSSEITSQEQKYAELTRAIKAAKDAEVERQKLAERNATIEATLSNEQLTDPLANAGLADKMASVEESAANAKENIQEAVGELVKNEVSANMETVQEATETMKENVEEAATVMENVTVPDVAENTNDGLEELKSQLEATKAKIDELEGSYERLEKAKALGGSGVKYLSKELKSTKQAIEEQKQKYDELTASIQAANEAMATTSTGETVADAVNTEEVQASKEAVEELTSSVENLKTAEDKIETVKTSVDQAAESVDNVNSKGETITHWSSLELLRERADEVRDSFYSSSDAVGYLKSQISSLQNKLANGIVTGSMDNTAIVETAARLDELRARLEALQPVAETTGESISRLGIFADGIGSAFSSAMSESVRLKGSFQSLLPTVSSLISSFTRIAKTRALRYALRQITSGISEGIENVYHYSEAIGSSFAPSMDSAASAIATMKNSLGAALAPAIESLIPYLNTLVNWFITLVNYANQFIALMRGQTTWTKATQQSTKAFDETSKSAKSASSSIKDLLADWDELNIIQSESSSGSGSSGDTTGLSNYLTMFEEVSDFCKELQSLVENLKDQFGDLWTLAGEVAAVILGWKFSSAFTGWLGVLAGLIGTVATYKLMFDVVTALDKTYLDTGNPGFIILDWLTTLVGGTLAQKMLTAVLGGEVGSLAIPLAFAISAAASITALIESTDVSVLEEKSLLMAMNAGLKGGIAGGLTLFSLGGYSIGSSVLGGVGVGAVTFGVAIGLKAIAQVADTHEITDEVQLANAISAGAVGGGLSLIAGAMGASGLVIAGAGLGGAALTALALITIEAIVKNKPKGISWGDYDATEKEIKDFVESNVFTTNAEAIINLVNPQIEIVKEKEKDLMASVAKVRLDIQKLELGVTTEDTLQDLEKMVFGEDGNSGLLGEFKALAKEKQTLIETGMTLVPSVNGNTQSIIDTSSEGWGELTRYMSQLGDDLAGHLQKAYSDGITADAKKMEVDTIVQITEAMARVSAAITRGEQQEEAVRALETNIANMSKGSWKELSQYINEYKQSIIDAASTTYDSVTTSLAGEVNGLKAEMENMVKMGIDTESEEYKYVQDLYNQKLAELEARRNNEKKKADIDNAVDEAMDEGTMERLRQAMLNKIKGFGLIGDNDIREILAEDTTTYSSMTEYLYDKLFNTDGTILYGANAKVANWLNSMINAAFGDDADAIRWAVDAGILKYSDVISEEMLSTLASTLGISGQSQEVQDAWQALLSSIMNKTPIEMTDKTVKDIQNEATETLEEAMPATIATAGTGILLGISKENIDIVDAQTGETFKSFAEAANKYIPDGYNGNVDLLNRPVIPVSALAKVGWTGEDENGNTVDLSKEDGIATLFSQTYSAGTWTKQDHYDLPYDMNVVISATPILPDGRVLDYNQLSVYIADLVSKSTETGIPILELDKMNLGVLLGVDEVEDGQSLAEAYQKAAEWLIKLHEEQEEYYKTHQGANTSGLSDEAKQVVDDLKSAMDLSEQFDIWDIQSAMEDNLNGFDNFTDLIFDKLFNTDGTTKEGAKEVVKQWLNDMVTYAFGDNADAILQALNSGYLSYGDLIGDDMLSMIMEMLDMGERSGEVQVAWRDLIRSLLSGEGEENGLEVPEYELEVTIDDDIANGITIPEMNTSGFVQSANTMASASENMATRIRNAFNSLNGIQWSMDLFGTHSSGGINISLPTITPAASGGIFKSGDIFSANENGQTEYIGSFGNKTGVANNNQIVSGISSGVATANSGLESRLGSIETLVNRILSKEFTATATPSSSWGAHNAKSSARYSKITGVY